MGGRKVCFIGSDGQCGTCIRDDENCNKCDCVQSHSAWLNKIAEKVHLEAPEDYHMKLCKQVHVLEQTVYGMRDLATACQRMGFEKISDELYWRAGNIEEVMEKVDQLILASMKQEHANLDIENAQLKQILKIMNG